MNAGGVHSTGVSAPACIVLVASLSLLVGPAVSHVALPPADPGAWHEVQQLLPENPDEVDPGEGSSMNHATFGHSMGAHGGLLAVGARHEAAVYVFERVAEGWELTEKLSGSFDGGFGFAVDLDADHLVVGAPFAETEGPEDHGSVYVFKRTESGYTLQQRFLPDAPTDHGYFGRAVSVSRDTLAVGARDDPSVPSNAGLVHVYELHGDHWEPAATFTGDPSSVLGFSVVLEDDRLLAGAPNRDEVRTYERGPDGWAPADRLHPPDPIDGSFGYSVDMDGDTVVVGAAYSDEIAGIYLGGSTNVGSTYVYQRDAGAWSLSAHLENPHPLPLENFGYSVAVNGDVVVVGAKTAEPLMTGAAYVYQRSLGGWSLSQSLMGHDTGPLDWFGWSVEATDGMILVGAPFDDNRQDGTPPPLDDEGDIPVVGVDEGEDSGAVYVFQSM